MNRASVWPNGTMRNRSVHFAKRVVRERKLFQGFVRMSSSHKSAKHRLPGAERGFRQLNGEKLLSTIHELAGQIEEKFPGSGLSGVARELEDVCALSRERIAWIAHPIWWLRVPRYLILIGLLSFLGFSLTQLFTSSSMAALTPSDWIQAIEAEVNLLVFGGAALLFGWGLERRIKRARALAALHELRSIVHVIDMHQISKDPNWLAEGEIDEIGSGSAKTLTGLLYYLDDSSDLIGLTGKVAALYLREMDDVAVVGTVKEIEDLATGISRKIWQKITLLIRLRDGEGKWS